MKYLLMILFIFTSTNIMGQDENSDVDHLALAGRLIKDGRLNRAKKLLSTAEKKINKEESTKLYLFKGLIALYEREFKAAAGWFEKSVSEKKSDPVTYAYYAQALFGLDDFQGTVDKLNVHPEILKEIPSLSLIKARSYRKLGTHNKALESLYNGINVFPDSLDLAVEEVDFFLHLGLVEQGYSKIRMLMSRFGDSLNLWMRVAKVFVDHQKYKKLLLILEEANLRYPYNEAIITQLAVTNLRLGYPLNAAMLFEKIAHHQPKYYKEAAELYMQSKKFAKAMALNGFIPDTKVRLRQRVALLTQNQRFEQVLGLLPALNRHELLKDEELKYAIAYAFFQTKQYQKSKTHLAGIQQPKLFEKATYLRKKMQTCNLTPWKCM